MYQIFLNKELFADSRSNELRVIDPVVNLEVNAAGTFEFSIPKTHPYFKELRIRACEVEVYLDDETEPLFVGILTQKTTDFFGNESCVFEGDLSYLNDSIQRPALYQNQTTRSLVTAYINNHNTSVTSSSSGGNGAVGGDSTWFDVDKTFIVGDIQVEGGSSILRYTNWNSTLQELVDDIIKDFDGYFRIRHENGKRILDILAEPPRHATQIVKLGENLLNYESNVDSVDLCTVLIPLGAKQETSSVPGLEEYLTIKSVNDGKDYLTSTGASLWGKVEKVVKWDDVTVASTLKSRGQAYLNSGQYSEIFVTADIIDLHYDNPEVERFRLMDLVTVKSSIHKITSDFMITKIEKHLDNPAEDKFTLGFDNRPTITGRVENDTVAPRKDDNIQNQARMITEE